MDRERLKEVHQTDLTESRVNEDLVDWLKTKGPTWLLLILVFLCVYLAIVRFKQHKADVRTEAWAMFQDAQLPGSYEDVAAEYGEIDQLGKLARIQAAEQLMRSVQSGLALESGPDPIPDPAIDPTTDSTATTDPQSGRVALSGEERDHYLNRADGLYQAVVDDDDGSTAVTLLVVNALNGRAAIAEARGDSEDARRWYLAAADRAESIYPGLARQARERAESTEQYTTAVFFLAQAEIDATIPSPPPRQPFEIEESLRDLLLPDEGEEEEQE